MISDETFPETFAELDDPPQYCLTNGDTCASTETFETSVYSSETCTSHGTSSADYSYRVSFVNDTTARTQNESEMPLVSPFASFDTSERKLKLTKAPSKTKKSSSCQDLIHSKKNYDHVQSKVKVFIDKMNSTFEDDRKRKTISRHKSMPLSMEPPIDDTFSEEKDASVLIKELRKKSVKIYELEEKCEAKDLQIYALEFEKSKMKMTFDKLRHEMHDLKLVEKDYHQMLAVSPKKELKSVSIQTEDMNKKFAPCINNDEDSTTPMHPIIRELTYSNNVSNSLDQTHFSDLNNASSDQLIPYSDISLEDISAAQTNEQTDETTEEEERKKTKKFRKFLKMMSCVKK